MQAGPSASPPAGFPGDGKGTRSPRWVVCATVPLGKVSPLIKPRGREWENICSHVAVRKVQSLQGRSGGYREKTGGNCVICHSAKPHWTHLLAAFPLSLSVSLSRLLVSAAFLLLPCSWPCCLVWSPASKHGQIPEKKGDTYFVFSSDKSQRRIFFVVVACLSEVKYLTDGLICSQGMGAP